MPLRAYACACASMALAIALVHSACAEEADCKPLFEAMSLLFNTPSHQYLKQTHAATGEKVTNSEIINTGKSMYILVAGKWRNSPINASQLAQQEEENRRSAKMAKCHLVREEAVDGVQTNLFNAHTETTTAASDLQLWIVKNNGLPLREIIDIDRRDRGGKSHAEIHVVYLDVEAPTGVLP